MVGKVEIKMVCSKREVRCRGRGIEQLDKMNWWLGIGLKTGKTSGEGVGWLVGLLVGVHRGWEKLVKDPGGRNYLGKRSIKLKKESNMETTSCIPQFQPWLEKTNLSLSVIELEFVFFMNSIVLYLIPFFCIQFCHTFFHVVYWELCLLWIVT